MLALVPIVNAPPAQTIPNAVATDEPTYLAFGRTYPDPQGCLAFGVPDLDGDGVKDTPKGVSPWAKGRTCAAQFLSYEEAIEGAKFLARRYPDFLRVIRLDQAYDNPNYTSAGIPRLVTIEDGKPRAFGRDRRPLYLFKVTDRTSPIPEAERAHFAFSLSIHGIERAGLEGGMRAMEDIVTWAACERDPAVSPGCAFEGPLPRRILETSTDTAVPTAGDTLRRTVLYFYAPNPDGWARGQIAPAEFEDGSPNVDYQPGVFFQRYNGNGVDLNRDWPSVGYTYRPYSPASEPEVRAYAEVLGSIRRTTAAGRFAGGIDLHGMNNADAFTYTMLPGVQRDWRRNAQVVDAAERAWLDHTRRLAWSPYVTNPDGVCDASFPCFEADMWGTVIDTIGYQVTGGTHDWMSTPLGLDAVGIGNEMSFSHLAPNTAYEPALEQSHIDGNKGLIFAHIASILVDAVPTTLGSRGRVGYVLDPRRLQVGGGARPVNPGLPAQNDIDVLLPCQGAVSGPVSMTACGEGRFTLDGLDPVFEFDVRGAADGVWNGGVTATVTLPNALGISHGAIGGLRLERFEGDAGWTTMAADYNQSPLYLQAGSTVTVNDPQPGTWRVRLGFLGLFGPPARLKIDFHPSEAERGGQAPINVSPMDVFTDLNRYVTPGAELQGIQIDDVAPDGLDEFDTIVVVGDLGSRAALTGPLGLTGAEADDYFAALRAFAEGGGNVVLTDGALEALRELGLVPTGAVARGAEVAGRYNFQTAPAAAPTYRDPATWPLAAGVDRRGAAERTLGLRQAVEPTPLGYTPDAGLDFDPLMPTWSVRQADWEASCTKPVPAHCVTARQSNGRVNLGETGVGAGVVRIVGVLLPPPVFDPDGGNDHRFGLSSYAPTYTGWQVLQNLIDYVRP